MAKSGEGGGVTHLLTLQLSHGSMPDSVYEVRLLGSKFYLRCCRALLAGRPLACGAGC